MQTLVINIEKKSDTNLLVNLVKKLGFTSKTLTQTEQEDWLLAKEIDKGMGTTNVSRDQIMKALGK